MPITITVTDTITRTYELTKDQLLQVGLPVDPDDIADLHVDDVFEALDGHETEQYVVTDRTVGVKNE